jgi:zinc protease
MKKLMIVLLLLCAIVLGLQAQQETTAFDADGIKVIFRPTTKNVINVRLYFRGGVTNYTAGQAGIENIALDATTKCGTAKYNAAAYRDTSDKYGITSYGTSELDFGYVQVNCISKYFDKGWDLFSAAVMDPVFEQNEVKLLKDKVIRNIMDDESDPEVYLDQLQMQNAFANTPYAINPLGSEESIRGLTTDEMKNYYHSILNKNRVFIVIVGNVTKQEIFEKVLLSFGNMPSRPYNPVDLKMSPLGDNRVFTENKQLKINYVGAVLNSPEFTNLNYVPFRMGISGLSGNIYYNLRTRLHLSYSASAGTFQLKAPCTMMYAATNNVQAVIDEMYRLLKNIKDEGVNEEWLQHIKNSYVTKSYINDQSASSITNTLGRAEILGGWQYAEDLPKLAQMTTVNQVNNALNFYLGGMRWTFLGNPEAFDGVTPPAH